MAKGMILAAGQGTRVRPLTRNTPKPMIPILGKPLLEYLIEHLVRHGIREIMINVAFNHYKIENFFGDGRRWGAEIGYSYEGAKELGDIVPRPLGSAGGMRQIQDQGGFFDETTLVLCGDALIDLDIGAALDEHRSKQALASVVTLEVPGDQVQNYGIVVADSDGRIRSFQEKPSPGEAKSNAASTGIYIFEPQVLELVPPGQVFDIGSQLFPMLVERGLPFYAQKQAFNWIDIGRLTDYWTVLQRVLSGELDQMEMRMPGREVRPGIWVGLNTAIDWDRVSIEGPAYIGSNVRLEHGASIVGPTWIGHGSQLRRGARVEQCILFEYTRLGEDQHFARKIVSPQYCVDCRGETLFAGDIDSSLRWGDARA
jgi:mannose-1-phosphate guanylyltransferase